MRHRFGFIGEAPHVQIGAEGAFIFMRHFVQREKALAIEVREVYAWQRRCVPRGSVVQCRNIFVPSFLTIIHHFFEESAEKIKF